MKTSELASQIRITFEASRDAILRDAVDAIDATAHSADVHAMVR